jgi:hypothetical protein
MQEPLLEAALTLASRVGHSTVTAQNRLFEEDNIPRVLQNMVDETVGRTGHLIVANDVKKFIRRGAATT